jgi:monosaccharide-transporting ATPase
VIVLRDRRHVAQLTGDQIAPNRIMGAIAATERAA